MWLGQKKTIALEVKNCYHIEDSKTRALVVKGLSRLPVTEEIAGSNPVERAKIIALPFGSAIFVSRNPRQILARYFSRPMKFSNIVPVYDVPPCRNVVGTLILIVKIIRMLPNVETQNWCGISCH